MVFVVRIVVSEVGIVLVVATSVEVVFALQAHSISKNFVQTVTQKIAIL